MDEILLIYSLPFPKDINRKIIIKYKYERLEKKYIIKYNELNKHLLYYTWLRKQLIKKNVVDSNETLLNIVKEYDVYPKLNLKNKTLRRQSYS